MKESAQVPMKQFTEVFIAEAVPSLNKGEEAILQGLLRSLEQVGACKVHVLSYYPEIDGPRHEGVSIVDAVRDLGLPHNLPERGSFVMIAASCFVAFQHLLFGVLVKTLGQTRALRIMRRPIWKTYCDSDVIIVGHDNVLANPYGYVLVFSYVYSTLLAKALGKMTVIYAGTVGFSTGPSTIPRYRLLARLTRPIWRWVDLITVRDSRSSEHLQEMGVAAQDVHTTADVAFLVQPSDQARSAAILEQEGVAGNAGPLIGVTLTHAITSQAAPELADPAARYLHGVRVVAAALDRVIQQLDATIIFLPHCIEPGTRDDRVVASDVIAAMERTERAHLISTEYDVHELKALIGRCDVFVGQRTHSVINAVSMQVPAINVTFGSDQRASSLLVGLLGDSIQVAAIEQSDAESLAELVVRVWETRRQIREMLQEKLPAIEASAARNGVLLKRALEARATG